MLVPDIKVGRLSLINVLELHDDKVSFRGVTPFYVYLTQDVLESLGQLILQYLPLAGAYRCLYFPVRPDVVRILYHHHATVLA